ncbi:hypothetical protein JMJ77_0004259, partial [Colletotrichum scovillei]
MTQKSGSRCFQEPDGAVIVKFFVRDCGKIFIASPR